MGRHDDNDDADEQDNKPFGVALELRNIIEFWHTKTGSHSNSRSNSNRAEILRQPNSARATTSTRLSSPGKLDGFLFCHLSLGQ